MVVAWLIGRWLGHRLRLRSKGKAAVSKFLDASLAVLGLLLAFTSQPLWSSTINDDLWW